MLSLFLRPVPIYFRCFKFVNKFTSKKIQETKVSLTIRFYKSLFNFYFSLHKQDIIKRKTRKCLVNEHLTSQSNWVYSLSQLSTLADFYNMPSDLGKIFSQQLCFSFFFEKQSKTQLKIATIRKTVDKDKWIFWKCKTESGSSFHVFQTFRNFN